MAWLFCKLILILLTFEIQVHPTQITLFKLNAATQFDQTKGKRKKHFSF